MVESYEVIEQKEILHEATAGLMAELHTLLADAHFDTDAHPDHPLTVFRNQLRGFWKSLLGSQYNTLEDMKHANQKYQAARERLESLRATYAG